MLKYSLLRSTANIISPLVFIMFNGNNLWTTQKLINGRYGPENSDIRAFALFFRLFHQNQVNANFFYDGSTSVKGKQSMGAVNCNATIPNDNDKVRLKNMPLQVITWELCKCVTPCVA